MAIQFHLLDVKLKLKDKALLKTLLSTIFSEEKVNFKSIDYIFCNDDYLLSLNTEFLQHDTLTDILTFTLSEPSLPIISEIYISIDRVKENAQKFETSFDAELHRVIIHGILHLCGYQDHTTTQKKKMREMENHYLGKLSST
ncbi:MAG: rRNA maturation RNase YbeY [Ginsengibacter sp.]|jgi:rRNA maturation RNase YbeY